VSAPSSTVLAERYRLLGLIGQGGMSRVWHGRDEVLDRDVAVKELVPPAGFMRDEVRERTLREARAAARLNHPNVVRVYDVFTADERPWIVMEYLPSHSLHDLITAEGPLPPARVAQLGLDVLAALRAAHASGVLHRDVKPSNVLLGEGGRVVLSDFGIATLQGEASVTQPGLVLGSPAYMAPERASEGLTGPESDLWSLGATLYAAVEGHPPYDRSTAIATLAALAAQEPDPAKRAGPLRPALDALLRRDPAKRADAAEAERLLRKALGRSRPVKPKRRPRPAPERLEPATVKIRPPRRHSPVRRAVVAAVAAVAILTLILVYADTAGRRQEQHSPPARSESTPTTGVRSPGPAPSRPGGNAARALAALPPGWKVYKDPQNGFQVEVPGNWPATYDGTIVYFREPGGGRVLGVDKSDHPKPDPLTDWRTQASYRVAAGNFPGYHEIKIATVSYFLKAADWEYTYDGRGGRLHVVNRNFVTSPTQAYAIFWLTPDAQWAANLPTFEQITATFQPGE
jgi:serine/threonine protein kinase